MPALSNHDVESSWLVDGSPRLDTAIVCSRVVFTYLVPVRYKTAPTKTFSHAHKMLRTTPTSTAVVHARARPYGSENAVSVGRELSSVDSEYHRLSREERRCSQDDQGTLLEDGGQI